MPLLSSMDGTSADAVAGLLAVCFPDAETTLDMTYGHGNFWNGTQPTIAGDRLPARAKDLVFDYHALPFADGAVDVTIFDPPFQPQTVPGQIGKRFTKITGGVGAVRTSVQQGCREAFRVGRLGCLVKVQDYIHDHKPVWMSAWVWEALGEPYDCLTLRTPSKLIATNWGAQKSVWRNHSTFYVWRRRSIR